MFVFSQDVIEVDAETKEMLKMMDFQSIPGLQMTTAGKQYSLHQLTSFDLLSSRSWRRQPQLPGQPQLNSALKH